MKPRVATELVLDAAAWRRHPKPEVNIHSDQGNQFASDRFNRWCKDNALLPNMSRRGKAGITQ